MADHRKLRKFLADPMGPRRWVIGGACFVAVGALFHLLQHQDRAWTSEPFIDIGVVMVVAGVCVELAIRFWLKA